VKQTDTRTGGVGLVTASKRANPRPATSKRGAHRVENENARGGRRKLYGVSTETVERLVAAQGGVCAICRQAEPNCVDHCHATGRIRGMLCKACNAGLGLLRDDPTLMRAAAKYLATKRG
jgi:hypothetical protein